MTLMVKEFYGIIKNDLWKAHPNLPKEYVLGHFILSKPYLKICIFVRQFDHLCLV